MSKNTTMFVTVKNDNRDIREFTARIIGFIDDEDTKAICNTEDSGRKIFHSDAYEYKEVTSSITYHKRVVFASSDYKRGERLVVITPKVNFLSFSGDTKIFNCEGKLSYIIRRSLY